MVTAFAILAMFCLLFFRCDNISYIAATPVSGSVIVSDFGDSYRIYRACFFNLTHKMFHFGRFLFDAKGTHPSKSSKTLHCWTFQCKQYVRSDVNEAVHWQTGKNESTKETGRRQSQKFENSKIEKKDLSEDILCPGKPEKLAVLQKVTWAVLTVTWRNTLQLLANSESFRN